MSTTIGELKELIKDLPDDMPVVSYSNAGFVDYRRDAQFYVVDRSEDEWWDEHKNSEEMKNWWKNQEVPDKVFVCDTD